MRRNGGRAGELRVAMHSAHRVGQAVGGGAGRNVVGMQRSARAAAGGDGEVLLAAFHALLLVGAGDQMLEAGRVGRVAGDGDVHALMLHNRDAFEHVVGAVAANLRLVAVRVRLFLHDDQLVLVEIVIGLHIGEAVDARNDVGRVLAETVEDDAQRLLADLVRRAGDADGALRRGKGFMSGEEAEALRLLAQQHRGEVAVAEADLAAFGDGAGDAEGLQADADGFGHFGRVGHALLERDGHAEGVGPGRVVERDGLNALDDRVYVDALGIAERLAVVERGKTVFVEAGFDLLDSSFVSFKLCHCKATSLFLSRVNILDRVGVSAVGVGILLERFLRVDAVFDHVHHLAEVNELVADDLAVRVQTERKDVALGHFQISHAFGLGGENGADLRAQALAEILERGADGQAVLGEGRLRAAVDELKEDLAHRDVDGVTYEVGVERFENRFALQNLGRHRRRMRHTRAAARFDERLLDNALLDVQGQLAHALLRRAPADAMGEAGDVADLVRLDPLALFGNGRRPVLGTLGDDAHVFDFM